MGYLSAIQIMNEKVLCALDHSSTQIGLFGSLIFIGGVVGSLVLGVTMAYVKRTIMWTKIICLPLAGIMVALIFATQIRNIPVVLSVLHFGLGFFAIG